MHSPSVTGPWADLRRALQDSGRLKPNIGRLRLLALTVVLVFVILASLHSGNAPLWTAVEGIGEVLVGMVAMVACAMRLERERSLHASAVRMQQAGSADASAVSVQRQAQTAWTLLTAAVCAWTVGQIAWTFSEVVMGIEPQAPSPLDVIFLSFSVLLVAGLLAMVRTPAGYLSHLRGASGSRPLVGRRRAATARPIGHRR
jgi:hypothetical protein